MFLVRDLSTQNRLLALKILLPSLSSNEDFLNMFFTEAKIASQLKHDNIVSIAGFGQVEGIHCLAMEFVFGASLAQVLRASARAKKPLTVGVLLRITASVCDALHYAHELRDEAGELMGLVHRDVTPQNILIGFNGVPKLTDFGIAKATGRGWETQAGIVKGKFSYMSPEQALGKKVDRRSDIFGAGIVLWEALTGRDLFKGSTAMDVLAAIREQKIDPPSKVVPGLTPIVDPIVMKALRRSPRSRYQTAAEMRDDIIDLIRRAGVDIDADTIAKEFYSIYGEDVTSRALELKKASMGKPDLELLAKALGAQPLNATQIPTVQGGVTDPDPLGLFPGEEAPPSRTRTDFEILNESSEAKDPLPKGTDWNTGDVEASEDELLSMLSEEDATVGHVPPEFVERLAKPISPPMVIKKGFVEDESTFNLESSDVLQTYSPTEGLANLVPEFAEDDVDLTEARVVTDDLLRGEQDEERPVPRAPSLYLEESELEDETQYRDAKVGSRPVPSAPSLSRPSSVGALPSRNRSPAPRVHSTPSAPSRAVRGQSVAPLRAHSTPVPSSKPTSSRSTPPPPSSPVPSSRSTPPPRPPPPAPSLSADGVARARLPTQSPTINEDGWSDSSSGRAPSLPSQRPVMPPPTSGVQLSWIALGLLALIMLSVGYLAGSMLPIYSFL